MKTSSEYIVDGMLMVSKTVAGMLESSKQKEETPEKTLWRIQNYIESMCKTEQEPE